MRRTGLSLLFGSASAALICTEFKIIDAALLCWTKFLETTHLNYLLSWQLFLSSDRLPLLLFIVCINLFISLVHKSGVVYGYYNFLSTRLTGKTSAELSCLILGSLLFIDDYLNVMTNGRVSVMLCQKFKIPRLKISFLITCLAAPLCSLIPISSWAAEIIGTISGAIEKTKFQAYEPFYLLASAAPCIFYSIILIIMAFLIVIQRLSFGKILFEEKIVEKSDVSDEAPSHIWKFNIFHFIVPVVGMIFLIIMAMMFFGGYTTSTWSMIESLRSNPSPGKALFLGTLTTVIMMIATFLPSKVFKPYQLIEALKEGLSDSKDIIFLIVISNCFGKLISQVGTGQILAEIFLPTVSFHILPTVIFLVSALIAFLLGSSWATMAIIFPTTLPIVDLMTQSLNPTATYNLLLLTIGAILSGVIFGSSFSPVSDLLIMSSKSCKVSHDQYLRVQLEYLPLIGLGAICSFVISGFLLNSSFLSNCIISASIGLGISYLTLLFMCRKKSSDQV